MRLKVLKSGVAGSLKLSKNIHRKRMMTKSSKFAVKVCVENSKLPASFERYSYPVFN